MKSRNVKVLGGLLLVFAGGAQAEDVEDCLALAGYAQGLVATGCFTFCCHDQLQTGTVHLADFRQVDFHF